jgi:hypothetical protein
MQTTQRHPIGATHLSHVALAVDLWTRWLLVIPWASVGSGRNVVADGWNVVVTPTVPVVLWV